ncbi:MAG: arginyl-tRNA--protein-N-Asp/Glu arginylyltransferase [Myxococcota bacterium]|jgi:arginyl-tRNA--protein-N-Asp/Glu arginylyltransferase
MHIEMHHPERIAPEALDHYLGRGWYRMVQSIFTCRFVMMGGDLHSALWIRLDLSDYRFRKGLRKLMRRNARQFQITCEPASLDPEAEALFQRYRANFQGELSESLRDSLYGDSGRVIYNTWRFSIRDEGRLVALSFFDLGEDSMQSVMGIYDPDYSQHSLGFTTMLLEIEYGIQAGIRYFYPGYVSPGYPAFDYKLRIGDVEWYEPDQERWLPWPTVVPDALPAAKIKTALAEVQAALDGVEVENRLRMYPPYRVASLDRRLELCLKEPLFVECHPRRQDSFCMLITYDFLTESYQLELCLRYADISDQLGVPETKPGGPLPCLELLQGVMRLGEARSAEAIARTAKRLGSVV